MKSIPYGKHFISEEDISAVVETLRSDYLTQGPKVLEFEKKFAEYVGAKYAVAVANGTAALHLSVLALGLKSGQKVITTPITFAASANCVRYAGADVVFVDIDPETVLIDIQKIREILERNPRGTFAGIIPVDFAGYPVDLSAVREIADEYGLWVLEDACHAPGGYFFDHYGITHRCGDGSLADLAIFSFHPVKHIATGEGGMITTNRDELYEKLLRLRTHGITKVPEQMLENHGGWYYEMQDLGYNYRMPDILASLGISQLERADENLRRRREIAKRYDEAFQDAPIKIIKPKENFYHAYHLYVIQLEKRKELYEYLREKQIYAQVHYIPLHLMPYYKNLGWKKGDFPAAEAYYDRCLSLPMYPTLREEDQEYVIKNIDFFFSNSN